MIDGVIIKELNQFKDERGWLAELWRRDETDYAPAMAYVSRTEQDIIRGPHEHRAQSDYFVFSGPGTFELYLWENREGRERYREREVLTVGEENPTLVIVPPGVVHGYKCVRGPAFSINLANTLYKGEGKKEEVDEIRWEKDLNSPFIIDQ